jgi:hypothetical protein
MAEWALVNEILRVKTKEQQQQLVALKITTLAELDKYTEDDDDGEKWKTLMADVLCKTPNVARLIADDLHATVKDRRQREMDAEISRRPSVLPSDVEFFKQEKVTCQFELPPYSENVTIAPHSERVVFSCPKGYIYMREKGDNSMKFLVEMTRGNVKFICFTGDERKIIIVTATHKPSVISSYHGGDCLCIYYFASQQLVECPWPNNLFELRDFWYFGGVSVWSVNLMPGGSTQYFVVSLVFQNDISDIRRLVYSFYDDDNNSNNASPMLPFEPRIVARLNFQSGLTAPCKISPSKDILIQTRLGHIQFYKIPSSQYTAEVYRPDIGEIWKYVFTAHDDGKHIVVSYCGKAPQIFEFPSFDLKRTLAVEIQSKSHHVFVQTVSCDGKLVAGIYDAWRSSHSHAALWSFETGDKLRTISLAGAFEGARLLFTADSRRLMVAGEKCFKTFARYPNEEELEVAAVRLAHIKSVSSTTGHKRNNNTTKSIIKKK